MSPPARHGRQGSPPARRKSLTASLLAEEIGLTGAAVTALVDRLEAGGYVRRERDTDDRRRVTIHAVPEKVRELDYLYDGISVAMSGLLSKYKKAEFATITDYFTNAITILTEQTKALRHNDLETSQDKKGRKRKAPVAAD